MTSMTNKLVESESIDEESNNTVKDDLSDADEITGDVIVTGDLLKYVKTTFKNYNKYNF